MVQLFDSNLNLQYLNWNKKENQTLAPRKKTQRYNNDRYK